MMKGARCKNEGFDKLTCRQEGWGVWDNKITSISFLFLLM